MKKNSVKLIGSAMAFFLFAGLSYGQTCTGDETKTQQKDQLKIHATDPALAGDQTMIRDQKRDKLFATLTDEQKAILQNTEMTREQKRLALQELLTEEQLALMQQTGEMRSQQKHQFKSNVAAQNQVVSENCDNTQQRSGSGKGNGGKL